MIQLINQPRFLNGHLFGLSRSSLELRIRYGDNNLDNFSWSIFEKITHIIVDQKIKNNPTLELSDYLNLINEIFSTLRIPTCANFHIKKIGNSEYQVFIPYFYPKLTLEVILLSNKTLVALESLKSESNKTEVGEKIQLWYQEEISKIKKNTSTNVNNFFILSAADRLNIAANQSSDGQWTLGHGKNSRNFDSTLTDKTPLMSVLLAMNKHQTAKALNQLGFPGAEHTLINKEDELVNALNKIGYPAVIKPADQERGIGVSSDLINFQDALIGFQLAKKHSDKILVEKHQPGYTHRLSIVNHKIIKVVKRIAGGVIGDGIHTIEQLILTHQSSATYIRRMQRKQKHMLALDDEAKGLLKQYGLNQNYIPRKGQYVKLRRRDNINAGGDNLIIDIKKVHPDNIQLSEDISKQFNFDIVGIDLIIEDIEKSWLEIGATVCELNAKPQMAAYNDNSLYENFLVELVPNLGRISITLCIYDSLKIDSLMNILSALKGHVKSSSFTSHKDGIFKKDQRLTKNFTNSFLAARAAIFRKDVDSLLMLISSEEISKFGSPIPINQIDETLILSNTIDKNQMETLLSTHVNVIELDN